MSEHHTLAKNTLLLTAASIGQKVIAFVYFTLVANFFGDAHTGAYFLALALITTIGVVDDIGLTSLLTREVAKRPNDATLWLRRVMGYKIFTIPVTIILAFVLPPLLGYDAETALLVRVAVGVMIADTLSLTFFGVLRGMQNVRFESIGMFVGQLLTAVVGIVLIVTGQATLFWLIVALIVGSVWNALFSGYHVVRRLGARALMPLYDLGTAPLKASLAFFLAAVFVKIYGYLDSFVINAHHGEAAVGVYSIAYKATYAFQFLPLVFVGALYPSMSAAAHEPEKLRKIFLAAEWYVALLAAPIVVGIATLANEIVGLLYEPQFAAAGPTLSVLVFVLIFIFLDYPIGSLLNATHRQYTKTAIMGATMVINATVNFALIPSMGIMGAAIAALMSFVCMFTAGWIAVAGVVQLRYRDLIATTGKFFVCAALMGAVVLAVKAWLPLMFTIALGGAVYIACIFATKAVTMEHMRAFIALIRRKTGYVQGIDSHA